MILAADFRDRIVHHLLVDHLEQIWEPVFIHDSYACRRGKGVHRGVARLQRFIAQVSANGTRRAWYLQLDIANYFMSIDRHILSAMLAARLDDEVALALTHTLVFHEVTEYCEVRGRPGLIERIPPHETLFGAGPGKGCVRVRTGSGSAVPLLTGGVSARARRDGDRRPCRRRRH